MAAKYDRGYSLFDEWEAARQAERAAGDTLAQAFDTYCLGEQTVDAVVEAIENRETAAERMRDALVRLRKYARGRARL